VFVVRDFHFKGDNDKKTKEEIFKDVEEIWGSIYKPEVYKSTRYTDFFDIEFCFMPHKIFFED
jgi:hypothetical protein